jgi:hypothetical protein
VDHGIEGAECVDLFGHLACLGDTCQVADDDFLRARNGRQRLLPSLLVSRMQNDAVPLLD